MSHAAELRPKAQRMREFVRTVIDKERLKALQAMILELERRARESGVHAMGAWDETGIPPHAGSFIGAKGGSALFVSHCHRAKGLMRRL
jgi:hypothetical protein